MRCRGSMSRRLRRAMSSDEPNRSKRKREDNDDDDFGGNGAAGCDPHTVFPLLGNDTLTPKNTTKFGKFSLNDRFARPECQHITTVLNVLWNVLSLYRRVSSRTKLCDGKGAIDCEIDVPRTRTVYCHIIAAVTVVITGYRRITILSPSLGKSL